MCNRWFCSWHFYWHWQAVNIMSMVPLLGRNPLWDSGRIFSDKGMSLLAKTRARIFPVVDRREMPQSAMSPFLNMETVRASLYSAGISSLSHIFSSSIWMWLRRSDGVGEEPATQACEVLIVLLPPFFFNQCIVLQQHKLIFGVEWSHAVIAEPIYHFCGIKETFGVPRVLHSLP